MLTVLDLAREDTTLKKKSRNEQCGPCPDPACMKRTDGFNVKWIGDRWVFMCRGCWNSKEILSAQSAKAIGKPQRAGDTRGWGDAIDYLRHYRHMRYDQARAYLDDGQEVDEPQPSPAPKGRHIDYTSDYWQERTANRVKECEALLWLPSGAAALEYIRGRGLKDNAIKGAHLGYSEDGGIPRLVIPSYNEGRYVTVYLRDLRPDPPHRWEDASGGTKDELYGSSLQVKRPTVLVESAIDALSLVQECGNMVNVVATGGTEGGRSIKSLAQLARMPLVLVAFDADPAGDEGAQWWLNALANSCRLRPWLKDVNDMLVDNWDIRAWVGQAIQDRTAPAAPELTEEELFRAMPEEEQQAYLAAMSEPVPCSLCLDEGIVTPIDPDQDTCPRHAPTAPRLTRDEIIQRFNAIPDMVVSEVIPIDQEAAMKARVEQTYQRQSYQHQPSARSAFDSKKQPRWEDHGFVKDPQGNWREERRYRKELQESINHAINKRKQTSVNNVPGPGQLV